jgi:hypothetical protein
MLLTHEEPECDNAGNNTHLFWERACNPNLLNTWYGERVAKNLRFIALSRGFENINLIPSHARFSKLESSSG